MLFKLEPHSLPVLQHTGRIIIKNYSGRKKGNITLIPAFNPLQGLDQVTQVGGRGLSLRYKAISTVTSNYESGLAKKFEVVPVFWHPETHQHGKPGSGRHQKNTTSAPFVGHLSRTTWAL
jgi:hypothetical protein